MKISVITSVPWIDPKASQAQAYREAVEQVRFAEDLGFDCMWFTEHHFGTHGINSAVLAFAAYVAGITKRIRVGTAVVVTPLYHPVRLAEEIAAVDVLSGGRLELGLGSGYRLDEFRGVNIAPEEGRPRFFEILDILLKAWQGEPFSYDGKFYKVPPGITVRPVPLQHPHPPIWMPGVSPKTLEWVAQAGYRAMAATTGTSYPDVCKMRENFDHAWLKAGRRPEDAEFYVHVPVYVADKSYEQIEADMSEVERRFSAAATSGGTIYQKPQAAHDARAQGPLSPGGHAAFDFRYYYENHGVMGPPGFCLEKLEQWWGKLRFTHLTCHFNPGLPHPVVMKSMEMFARHVIPSLRDIDARR